MEAFSIFEKEAKEMIQIYNGWTFSIEDNCPVLYGSLSLNDENGILHDTYQVKIKPKDNYPFKFPYVFETEGRIPRNIDWHVFEDKGNFCIASEPDEILACKNGLTLLGFIENQIKPYLFNQTFRQKHGYFLNERPHGHRGWIQFFEDIVKTDNVYNIVFTLQFVLKRKHPDRTAKCFCNNGKKFRNCHKETYTELSKFEDAELIHYINKFKNLYSI